MKRKHPVPRFPPYPGSNRDYAVRHAAKILLDPPNRSICIYCHAQAPNDSLLKHLGDCPAKGDKT
jgi:hypothetical protein